MHERLRALWGRLGFAELMIAGVVLFAFVIGGLIGGTPVTIFRTCSGLAQAECPPDKWVALNPPAGLLAAAGVALALTLLDLFMRRRPR